MGCSYKAKDTSTLRKHQASIHGENVIFYWCKEEGCDYKATVAGNVKRHVANIHDIGVKWHCNDCIFN